MTPAPRNEGHSSFSGFTFTLTSLLRPAEHFLLIQGRFFPSLWVPDILLDAWRCVGANVAQKCQHWGVLWDSRGWGWTFERQSHGTCFIRGPLPMFLIQEPCEWFSRVSCFLPPSQAVEINSNARHWSFIYRIRMQVGLFRRLVDISSFIQRTLRWSQDNECKRAFWIFSRNDCSDYKRQVSVATRPRDCQSSLTLSTGSTPAKLIGPVEACRLSGVNTSMPAGDRSCDLKLKPNPDPGNTVTRSTDAQGDEGKIRVLAGDCGDKIVQLSSNCIWHL